MFGSFAKWVHEIDDPARIPEVISRAFHTATSGRPGPVVIALPEDLLTEPADCADAARYRTAEPHPAPADLATLRTLLAEAKRPFVILGGGGWSAEACADIQAFAESFELPVGVSFRRQDYFDNAHPQLRRPRRHLGRAAAQRPRARRRSPAARRHPARRGLEPELQPARHPEPAADPGPRSSRRRGARPAVRAGSADPRRDAGVRRRGAGARAGRRSAWREQTRLAHEQYLASLEPPPSAGRGPARRHRALAERSSARRRDRHQRRRQLLRLGQRLLPVPALPLAARADQRLDGLRHARRRSPPSWSIPSARSCASPATAAS